MVSNLIGSPASGEHTVSSNGRRFLHLVSNLIGSPASGEISKYVSNSRYNVLRFPI